MQKIKIGLLGLGNIGRGVLEILEENRSMIEYSADSELVVAKILVRDPEKQRGLVVPRELLTTAADDILEDRDISIIVELIGGIHPAYEYIKRALENGKHVVTANKAVIASYGQELFTLAREHHVSIRFEGSVGGGIPIIGTLTRSLSGNQVQEIIGIINGTTNYILTQMNEQGMPFDEALSDAQRKGFAEADPTSDIEGEDAAYKLAILTLVAFGVHIHPESIPRAGIRSISEEEIHYAKQLGYRIKLLASVIKKDSMIIIHVHPALVPNQHPLSAVNDEYNALFIRGNAVGELMLYGKGAGSLATGSAVVADIIETAGCIIHDLPSHLNIKTASASAYEVVGEGIGEYYIRLQVQDRPGVLGRITTTFGRYGISLASVVQRYRGKRSVPLVFVTHDVRRDQLDLALEEIGAFEAVEEVASILRVL